MQQAYPGPTGGYGTNAAVTTAAAPNLNPSSSPGSTAATGTATSSKHSRNGGRFDFDDGGTYIGGWEDGKAHGYGVCTGPKGQGAYSGSWHFGFEVSGVYTWPSGSAYEGQWQNGKRHGLGIESRGRWIYRGEWTQGFKGRYGARQSNSSAAKYEGTWANGLQDGYGSETYADGGTYQGQWLRGMRHGYGVRASAPFGLASHFKPKQAIRTSLTSLRSSNEGATTASSIGDASAAAAERDRRMDDARGGFVLKSRSDEPPQRRRSLVEKSLKKTIFSGLKRKQRSTGDLEQRITSAGSIRSNASSVSWVSTESSHSPANGGSVHTDSNASFIVEDEHMDASITETYMGEWKNDKRTGFGISERSDGLRYEGEWFNNKKYGYGVTILRDGSREEGKYKNNVLITSQKKKQIFLMRSAKFRERIDAAVNAAQRAQKISLQKADIAISRMSTSRSKAEMADSAAYQARDDFEIARKTAKDYDPDFTQPCLDKFRLRDLSQYRASPMAENKFSAQNSQQRIENYVDQNAHFYQPNIRLPNEHFANDSGNSEQLNFTPPLPPRGLTPQPQTTLHPRPSIPHQFSCEFAQNNNMQQQQNNYNKQLPSQYNNIVNQSSFDQHPQNYNMARSQFGQHNSTDSPTLQFRNPQNPQQNFNNPHNQGQQQVSYIRSGGYNNNNPQNPMFMTAHTPPRRPSDLNYTSKRPSLMPNHNINHNNNNNSSQYAYNSSTDSPSPQRNNPNFSSSENYRRSFDLSQQQQQNMIDHNNRQQSAAYYANTNRINNNNSVDGGTNEPAYRNVTLRRNSKLVSADSAYSFKQAMSDHFDHYARPPSRDSSVDRYTRAASRLSGSSRQPSVDRIRAPLAEPHLTDHSRNGSVVKASTPITGNGSVVGFGAGMQNAGLMGNSLHHRNNIQSQSPIENKNIPLPFEDLILRKRSLGQDILPSPIGQPKRTESLYNPGAAVRKDPQNKVPSVMTSLQRKKSLPDFQGLPKSKAPMSREEVSILSSARREEIRRVQEENERLRANPLLYLVSPHVKEWFSRQQLLFLILFINISLAILFFKLLTS